MVMSAEKFLKIPLEKLLEECQEEVNQREKEKDKYYKEMGDFIDTHPIGTPRLRYGLHQPD